MLAVFRNNQTTDGEPCCGGGIHSQCSCLANLGVYNQCLHQHGDVGFVTTSTTHFGFPTMISLCLARVIATVRRRWSSRIPPVVVPPSQDDGEVESVSGAWSGERSFSSQRKSLLSKGIVAQWSEGSTLQNREFRF